MTCASVENEGFQSVASSEACHCDYHLDDAPAYATLSGTAILHERDESTCSFRALCPMMAFQHDCLSGLRIYGDLASYRHDSASLACALSSDLQTIQADHHGCCRGWSDGFPVYDAASGVVGLVSGDHDLEANAWTGLLQWMPGRDRQNRHGCLR